MSRARRPSRTPRSGSLAAVRARLAVAEETLRALGSGKVDSVVIAGKRGDRVFTLEGAEHAYRVLIESMNEGALTLGGDSTVVYANAAFALMVGFPLEKVIGTSFQRFLSKPDRLVLGSRLIRTGRRGAKFQVLLKSRSRLEVPVQISIRPLAKNGSSRAAVGMVVTDVTAARHAEDMLRALAHRVVQVQEDERSRLALDLHDNVTQLLIGATFHSQALVDTMGQNDGLASRKAVRLRGMLGEIASELERVSRGLRASVLDQMGLTAVLQEAGREFTRRTLIPAKLHLVPLTRRLAPATELALFRILQEALKNVEKHARARSVTVSLRRERRSLLLAIADDGRGFQADTEGGAGVVKTRLGLLGMRERAAAIGGALTIISVPGAGTGIEVRVPWTQRPRGTRSS